MPRVFNVLKASEGPPLWWVIDTSETAIVAPAGRTQLCDRCQTGVAASRESAVYLLEGAWHHPACIIEAMAGSSISNPSADDNPLLGRDQSIS